MNPFRTVIGIDPSGRRLALAALRFGVGGPSFAAAPMTCELHGEKEDARREESSKALADYVARNGLAGADARLLLPAGKVFVARISLPPLREKDIRPAIRLELERLFPFPASRLVFDWRRLPEDAHGGKGRCVVVAAPAEEISRWEEAVARAGLQLAGVVPSAWGLASACRGANIRIGTAGEVGAILRQADGWVECAVLDGSETIFTGVRPCDGDTGRAEGLSLLSDALVDLPPSRVEAGVSVVAPPDWPEKGRNPDIDGSPLRWIEWPEAGGTDGGIPSWSAAGAYGAASAEKGIDLLSTGRGRGTIRETAGIVTYILAAAVALLAISWPAASYLRAKQDLSRLEGEIAALRSGVERVEDSLALLGGIEERVTVLRDASADRERPLRILRDLTERLPQGAWLTGLRVEDRKVEMDGLAPSASEIFPVLSLDGRFGKVEFASPITRQPDNLERFQIRAEYAEAAPRMEGEKAGRQ